MAAFVRQIMVNEDLLPVRAYLIAEIPIFAYIATALFVPQDLKARRWALAQYIGIQQHYCWRHASNFFKPRLADAC